MSNKISPALGCQALLMCCMPRFVWLFLEHMGSKCNLAVLLLLLLIIELAVRWYGKHPKKIFLTSKWGLIFFILKCMHCFVHLCIDQMQTTSSASTVVHEADAWGSWIVCVISFVYQEFPYCCTGEQFMGNCGPQNEAQNVTYCAKMLLINWWVL